LMMWRELRDGSLVCPVIDPPSVTLVTQFLVCPHAHLRHSKVRAFLDWVREERDKWAGSERPLAQLQGLHAN
jgi:LysR family transcriptional regulator, glycine cleavage system transcriptional activator